MRAHTACGSSFQEEFRVFFVDFCSRQTLDGSHPSSIWCAYCCMYIYMYLVVCTTCTRRVLSRYAASRKESLESWVGSVA